MELLDWRYTGRERDTIQLTANLGLGWKDLSKPGQKRNYWGFDESVKAEYQGNSFFRCHLYVAALAPHSSPSAQSFPSITFAGNLGRNSVQVNGQMMIVEVRLTQGWGISQQGRPLVYEISDRLFQAITSEEMVDYRAQLWVVHHGDDSMFVKNEYERGDGFAWIGGRPESNRRKF
jgi:hypothetical protein